MLEDKNGKDLVATQTFGELTLSIVIDCVFGGEDFLPTHKLAHLWDQTNKAMNGYFMSVLFLGPTVRV